jgi:hypothetical protein
MSESAVSLLRGCKRFSIRWARFWIGRTPVRDSTRRALLLPAAKVQETRGVERRVKPSDAAPFDFQATI